MCLKAGGGGRDVDDGMLRRREMRSAGRAGHGGIWEVVLGRGNSLVMGWDADGFGRGIFSGLREVFEG